MYECIKGRQKKYNTCIDSICLISHTFSEKSSFAAIKKAQCLSGSLHPFSSQSELAWDILRKSASGFGASSGVSLMVMKPLVLVVTAILHGCWFNFNVEEDAEVEIPEGTKFFAVPFRCLATKGILANILICRILFQLSFFDG